MATAGQVAPGSAPLSRAAVPRAGCRRGSRDRVVRDLVHRSLPARTVRLRRRGRPVGAARAGLRIPPPHRLLSPLQPPLIFARESGGVVGTAVTRPGRAQGGRRPRRDR